MTRERRVQITGVVQITRKGVGYVARPLDEKKKDVEIETADLGGALNGDVVQVELETRAQLKGRVINIISRNKTCFVATVQSEGKNLIAIPVDPKFYRPILLSNTSAAVKEKSKVLVKLISFTVSEGPIGEIVRVIGQSGEHQTEMNAIVLEHGFSTEFLPQTIKKAQAIEQNHSILIETEALKRADYRDIPTFTIDPPNAKDFDDALSVKELGLDEYEIGIHIADVTFFIEPGGTLDEEARKRGVSVYLVDTTIPMLPHQLSGNVCSLKENEDRLTFSVTFRINSSGEILGQRFEKSIIRSKKRFSYDEAQQVLEYGKGPFIYELSVLNKIARILKKKRQQDGAIDFGDNEVQFTLDQLGRPTDIRRTQRLETNSLVEEFMLLANRKVAQHITELAKKVPEKNLIFLYRIHDAPKQDRIEELAIFVRAIGYDFGKNKKRYSARDIAKLLKQIEGQPEESLIRNATLRAMAKAIYSTKNIGHFGLSFENYTHFTSPIRRYPDMLVHRVLASHINGNPITRKEFSNLEQLCIDASEKESKAVSAERESIRYKQIEYMQSRIGSIFSGVITGVVEWGLYVEEQETATEGLIRVRTLGEEYFTFVPKQYSLIGERTKKKFSLGDQVQVKLVGVDITARTVDFVLA